ncbi:MAG: NUDIX hydrolase [Chryseobacterium sp.]|nr:MAG: NUDIX hydrolase [Chryseobacterium sp.]
MRINSILLCYTNFMTKQQSLGIVDRTRTHKRIDYLYRISIKSLIRNDKEEVLVVKETGRDWWDLPGGGMDHGEDLEATIAREMKEEVNLEGSFTYRVICIDEPAYLEAHDFWQIRLIFELKPSKMKFSAGDDGDEVRFINPEQLKDSLSEVERRIYRYASINVA